MQYKLIYSLAELPKFNFTDPIFADIETDDLYGDIRMIQLYQPTTSELVYVYDLAPIGYNLDTYKVLVSNLKDWLMLYHTVWFNSSYDLGTLNISPSKVDDLFYAVKTAYPEFMEFGLKKIVKKLRYTQELYKGIDTDEVVKGFVKGSYISQQAYKYAALDVYALSLIWLDKKIQNVIQNNLAYKVDMISQGYALIYQQNGLLLNRDKWAEELINSKQDVVKYTALLPKGLNPNSFKQVRAYLNITESDNEALVAYSLSDADNAIDATYIIKLKGAIKQVSYLESVNWDRMITKFNVAGAVTGRFTSAGAKGALKNGFNAQQIPRNLQYLFNMPTEDTIVIHADYSTLELRLASAIYDEPVMAEQLRNGEDLHTEMAKYVSGKDEVTKADRQGAKGVNFGFVFGMSAKSFVPYAFTTYGVKFSEEEAINVRFRYFSKYPSIARYHSNVWNDYKKLTFFVETALGRKVKPKLGTDGINTPVQGSGAECTKLAVHYLIKDNPSEKMLSYIYNVVHDAIYLRVPRDKEYIGNLLKEAMIKAWREISKCNLFKIKDIPILCEVEIEK